MESTTAVAVADRRTLVSLFARLRRPSGQANPLPAYDQLLAMGDMVPAPWGGYLVTSYRLCQQALRDKRWGVPDTAWRLAQDDVMRWGSPASLQMSTALPLHNPPEHTRRRKSIGNVFNHGFLATMRPWMENTAERLIAGFGEELRRGPSDFVTRVGDKLPVNTVGSWMGLPPSDFPFLFSLTQDQVQTLELFPSKSELARANEATAQLRPYFARVVQARRDNPGDDPVSSWIRTWDALEPDREIADSVIHDIATFMILAAVETSSHLLSSAVRLLLEHPQQWNELRERPELVPHAVEEVLRYDTPIHMISRVAPTDIELDGVLVRSGEMLQLLAGTAHHDPAQYDDPHRFDIHRRPTHLSFGTGIHYCLGNALARLQAEVLLTTLLRQPFRLRIAAPPQWAPRVAFRRMTTLPLALA